MFQPVTDSNFVTGEHSVLKLWRQQQTFQQLRRKNAGRKRWSFLDGPITANNPMGVHHAWGRTYKDTYQRFFAMTGHDQRFQNGFDCQGLWVKLNGETPPRVDVARRVQFHLANRKNHRGYKQN